MPTSTLLATQNRGSVTAGPFHINAATPRFVDFTVNGAAFDTVGTSLAFSMERSLNGGTTWVPFGGATLQSGALDKRGLTARTWGVGWDGQTMDVRGSIVVAPGAFVWGLSITF